MYLGKDFSTYLRENNEVGFVETMNSSLVGISGLPQVFIGEVVMFSDSSLGLVMSLGESLVRVLLLGKDRDLRIGVKVARTKLPFQVYVSDSSLGGVFDSAGKPLFKGDASSDPRSALTAGSTFGASPSPPTPTSGNFASEESRSLMHVFKAAPDFMDHEKISAPLITGVSIVDLMVPLGKGQRELVLGDKKSGKTEFLKQTMASQIKEGSVCIYAGIGKNREAILDVLNFSKKAHLGKSFILIGSSSSDSPGKVYLTPYTAMAFAEYFRDKGRDVLLVLDDMSSHAKYYRELSLIGGSFPGRESYPGDMFFAHSGLFERAGNFKVGDVANSITCLPVAETVEGDISGYIQTNLMSMTDGHIFFDSSMFDQGKRPAVNTFLSVTRVGRQVQSMLHQSLHRELSGFLSLLRKHERFVHFGAELSEGIRESLETGKKVTAFFNQPPQRIYPLNVQYFLFALVWGGLLAEKQTANFEFLAKKLSDMYEKDSDFRQYVDKLIGESPDFNALLSNVTGKSDTIKDLIGINI